MNISALKAGRDNYRWSRSKSRSGEWSRSWSSSNAWPYVN